MKLNDSQVQSTQFFDTYYGGFKIPTSRSDHPNEAQTSTDDGETGCLQTYWCLVGNGWEWVLLGLLLIVIVDHSRKFPTKHK
jgi:hypothetical protein